MICPQVVSAKAELCKGSRDEDLKHQSVMWITQHMYSESDS